MLLLKENKKELNPKCLAEIFLNNKLYVFFPWFKFTSTVRTFKP